MARLSLLYDTSFSRLAPGLRGAGDIAGAGRERFSLFPELLFPFHYFKIGAKRLWK
ncbi:hypothetical protein Aazo_1970 ['Nostoc azollae' 0708]|uniref:Uncharacterized protein n=1 Tax=Nostoc azollae (strain 0708) TaxID=551115 RepID=D7DWD1_NOSA0|nr:hypothetical protein Aazo_1970 ['Nostoc azollae' 0708]